MLSGILQWIFSCISNGIPLVSGTFDRIVTFSCGFSLELSHGFSVAFSDGITLLRSLVCNLLPRHLGAGEVDHQGGEPAALQAQDERRDVGEGAAAGEVQHELSEVHRAARAVLTDEIGAPDPD